MLYSPSHLLTVAGSKRPFASTGKRIGWLAAFPAPPSRSAAFLRPTCVSAHSPRIAPLTPSANCPRCRFHRGKVSTRPGAPRRPLIKPRRRIHRAQSCRTRLRVESVGTSSVSAMRITNTPGPGVVTTCICGLKAFSSAEWKAVDQRREIVRINPLLGISLERDDDPPDQELSMPPTEQKEVTARSSRVAVAGAVIACLPLEPLKARTRRCASSRSSC